MAKGYQHNPLKRSRVFEALLLDGGWLTPEGLSLEVGTKPDSIQATLRRYVERGLIEVRERPNNSALKQSYEYRISDAALTEYEC